MTRTSTILQFLLFGGEKEWAKDPLAASTLVQMGKLTQGMIEIVMTQLSINTSATDFPSTYSVKLPFFTAVITVVNLVRR